MDHHRFDNWIKSFGTDGSRRSLVAKLAKGGAAALLAGVGLTTLGDEAAEANHCSRRCRKLRKPRIRRRCLRRCRQSHRLATPIGVGTVPNGGTCTLDRQCHSGNCFNGFCADCDGIRLCGTSCCLITAECLLGLCVRL